MPAVSSSGTYDKDDAGFELLAASTFPRILRFSGSTLGTSCTIKVLNDAGAAVDISGGVVSSVTDDKYIITSAELQLEFVGSPDCNVTIEVVRNP